MINNFFPIPVYRAKTRFFDLIQDEVKQSIYIEKNNLDGIEFKGNIINECKMERLKKEIYNHIDEYKKHISFGKTSSKYFLNQGFSIKKSWITRLKEGKSFALHNHIMHDISGCYYYNSTGVNGDLFFEIDGPWGGQHSLSPEEGEIILFPSWLKHGVTTNNTNDVRISVVFDIVFNR